MTAHLRRLGHQVSVATVDRLDRNFTAACPNRVWVADFTYCRTWAGFVYVAFVIDVFSRKIVGWHAMTTRPTELVTVPLRMALWNRRHEGSEIFEGLIHHSDAGSQYVSLKFSEELMLEGVLASIGSVGDAYDNALAETTIGLFKTEAIRPGNPFHPGPFKTIEDIEFAGLGLG